MSRRWSVTRLGAGFAVLFLLLGLVAVQAEIAAVAQATFTNYSPIAVPGSGSSATVNVVGLVGGLKEIRLSLYGVTTNGPVNLRLAGSGGQRYSINGISSGANGLVFTDTGYPGTNPNGPWQLFVVDNGTTGMINGGFDLTAVTNPVPTTTTVTAAPNPSVYGTPSYTPTATVRSTSIALAPTGTATGPVSASLTIEIPAGAATPTTISLTGNVTAAPQGAATVSPAAFNFGNAQLLSPTLPQSFTLTNNGTRAVGVSGAAITGTDAASFSVVLGNNCTGAVLNPGQSCSVQVVFRPTVTGPLQARLSFATDAPGSPHVVALYGVGITPRVTITTPTNPGRLDFGDVQVGTQRAAQRVTLTNSTTGPVSIGTPTASSSAAFKVTNDHCAGQALAASATCTFDVYFAPIGAGAQSADITFDAGGTTYTITAYGVGVTPQVTITPNDGSLYLH